MPDYTNLTPEERFNALEKLAKAFFKTERWKVKFARKYDLTEKTLNNWMHKGAPLWSVIALSDALQRQSLSYALKIIRQADID